MSTPFPKRLVVEVTEEDIEEGRCGNPFRCAVALAIKRIYPELTVSVGCGSVGVYPILATEDAECLARWDHSDEAALFVDKFDHERQVEPCTLSFHQVF